MDFGTAFLISLPFVLIAVASVASYISIENENRKENNRSSILFNADLKDKECYRYPEEIFETLEKKGIKLNYLGNHINP